jgi:hypothetical protein
LHDKGVLVARLSVVAIKADSVILKEGAMPAAPYHEHAYIFGGAGQQGSEMP